MTNFTPQKTLGFLVKDPRETPKGKPVWREIFFLNSSQQIKDTLTTNFQNQMKQTYLIFCPAKFSKYMPNSAPNKLYG